MVKWILKKWDVRCGLKSDYERIMWHVLVDVSLKNEGKRGRGEFLELMSNSQVPTNTMA